MAIPTSTTVMHHVAVKIDPKTYGIPDHALVIEQSFDQPSDGSIWEPQILAIAESEDQCFEALSSLNPELTKANLLLNHGSYYPLRGGKPYDGGGLVLIINNQVPGLEASSNLATFTMHMSQDQLSELQEFLISIWA